MLELVEPAPGDLLTPALPLSAPLPGPLVALVVVRVPRVLAPAEAGGVECDPPQPASVIAQATVTATAATLRWRDERADEHATS